MLDFSIIFAFLLKLWWLLPIIAIMYFFKSATGKGIIGEGMLNLFINTFLDKKEYRLLKDVTLPSELPRHKWWSFL